MERGTDGGQVLLLKAVKLSFLHLFPCSLVGKGARGPGRRRIQMKLFPCAVSGQCSLILAFFTVRIELENLGSNARILRQRPLCCPLRHCLCRTCCGLTGCWPCDGIKRGMPSRRSCVFESFVHSSRSHLRSSRVDALEHGRVLQHVRDNQVPAVTRGRGNKHGY